MPSHHFMSHCQLTRVICFVLWRLFVGVYVPRRLRVEVLCPTWHKKYVESLFPASHTEMYQTSGPARVILRTGCCTCLCVNCDVGCTSATHDVSVINVVTTVLSSTVLQQNFKSSKLRSGNSTSSVNQQMHTRLTCFSVLSCLITTFVRIDRLYSFRWVFSAHCSYCHLINSEKEVLLLFYGHYTAQHASVKN